MKGILHAPGSTNHNLTHHLLFETANCSTQSGPERHGKVPADSRNEGLVDCSVVALHCGKGIRQQGALDRRA
jgi:hypothetical protein